MSSLWFEYMPRSVVGSMVTFGALLAFLLGIAYGPIGVIGGAALSWLLHWTFWVVRYAYTRYVWKKAAGHYGLEFGRRDPNGGIGPISTIWPHGPVELFFPSQLPFELQGDVDDRPVRVFVEGKADETTTTWEIDCTEFLPEHVTVEPAPLAARAGRWVDIEDVSVGHTRLDERARIGGRDPDFVRDFFWEHDLGDVIDELFDDVTEFSIAEGHVRLRVDGCVRLPRSLVRPFEQLRTIADRLELAVTESPDESEASAASDEKEQPAEEVAHVYD